MRVTEEELAALASEVVERGARFGLVVFPFYFQLLAPSLDAPQRHLEAFASARGLPFLDVHPVFLGHEPRSVLLDHDHPTPFGHELAAGAIADWLERDALLP
jgi:lysophospholipase L1-like esterase